MSNFDVGRQHDLRDIDQRLEDPKIPARAKRKMRRTKARLLEQEHMPDVRDLRRRYLKAIQAKDFTGAEKLAEQLRQLDQRLGLDNRKL